MSREELVLVLVYSLIEILVSRIIGIKLVAVWTKKQCSASRRALFSLISGGVAPRVAYLVCLCRQSISGGA